MALRQTMHTQLEHGQETLKVLGKYYSPTSFIHSHSSLHLSVNSSSKIKETKTGMEEIGINIKVGQGLISKLDRRDITDKVLITLAVIFFFSVVLYIIRKRLIGWII